MYVLECASQSLDLNLIENGQKIQSCSNNFSKSCFYKAYSRLSVAEYKYTPDISDCYLYKKVKTINPSQWYTQLCVDLSHKILLKCTEVSGYDVTICKNGMNTFAVQQNPRGDFANKHDKIKK